LSSSGCAGSLLDDGILDRQEQYEALLRAYFDKLDLQQQMRDCITDRLHQRSRHP